MIHPAPLERNVFIISQPSTRYKWVIERAVAPRVAGDGIPNGLSPMSRLVMLTLLSYADADGVIPDSFQPSFDDLVWATGVSKSTMSKALNDLEDRKWIVRHKIHRPGRGDRTYYELRVPDLDKGFVDETLTGSNPSVKGSPAELEGFADETLTEAERVRLSNRSIYVTKDYENSSQPGRDTGEDMARKQPEDPDADNVVLRANEADSPPAESGTARTRSKYEQVATRSVYRDRSKFRGNSAGAGQEAVLAGTFRELVDPVFGFGLGTSEDKLSVHVKRWLGSGVTPAEFRACVDAFVADSGKYLPVCREKKRPAWVVFTWVFEGLLTQVRSVKDLRDERAMLAAMPEADKVKYLQDKFGSWD